MWDADYERDEPRRKAEKATERAMRACRLAVARVGVADLTTGHTKLVLIKAVRDAVPLLSLAEAKAAVDAAVAARTQVAPPAVNGRPVAV